MKLQVAFDDLSLEKLDSILETSIQDIDIVEYGTLSVIRYGLNHLKEIREKYPNANLLVDPKIMDAPEKIARSCYESGADICTVMSVAGLKTCLKVLNIAKEYGKEVMVDLLNDQDPINTAKKLDEAGFDYLCVHSSTSDINSPLNEFLEIKKVVKNAKLSIAGGISLENIDEIVKAEPYNIIVGSSVYNNENPKLIIDKFKEHLK